MDSNLIQSLQTSRLKIKHLLEQQQHAEILLKNEQEKVKQLQQQLESEKNNRLLIAEQNKIAKLADAMLKNGADSVALEKVIDKHIRVLNTCIRLLSDR